MSKLLERYEYLLSILKVEDKETTPDYDSIIIELIDEIQGNEVISLSRLKALSVRIKKDVPNSHTSQTVDNAVRAIEDTIRLISQNQVVFGDSIKKYFR